MVSKVYLDSVLKAIEDEEEFYGEMPDKIYKALKSGNKKTIAEVLRIVVKLSKSGIKERILNIFENNNKFQIGDVVVENNHNEKFLLVTGVLPNKEKILVADPSNTQKQWELYIGEPSEVTGHWKK